MIAFVVAAMALAAPGDWPEPRQNPRLTGIQPVAGAMTSAPESMAAADLGRTQPSVRQVALADGTVVGLALHAGALYCFLPNGDTKWMAHPEGLNVVAIAAVEDLDGDGSQEILLQCGRPADPYGAAVLLSLDDGSLRWRYDVEPMSYAWYLDAKTYLPGTDHKQIVVLMHAYPPDPLNGYIALFDFSKPGAPPEQKWRYDFDAYTCFPSLLQTDLDGDGIKEIVVETHSRMWFLDAVTGAKKDFVGWDVSPANTRSYGLVEFRDLNGDGREDFLCIANFAQHHEVLLNNNGHFEEAWHYGWDESVTTGKVATVYPTPAVADVDGDGRLEVVLSMFNSEDEQDWLLRVYDAVSGELKYRMKGAIAQSLADLDNDGSAEILVDMSDDPTRAIRDGAKLLAVQHGELVERWSDASARAIPSQTPPQVQTDGGRFSLSYDGGTAALVPVDTASASPLVDFSAVPDIIGPPFGDLIAVDYDSDGMNEIGHYRNPTLTFYKRDGDQLTASATFTSTCLPVVVDLNGDGKNEVITVDAAPNHTPIVDAVTPANGNTVLWHSQLPPANRDGLPQPRAAYLRSGYFYGNPTPDLYLWAGTPIGRSVVLDGMTGERRWERGEVTTGIERYWGPTVNLAAAWDYEDDGNDDLVCTLPDYYAVIVGNSGDFRIGPEFPPTIFNQPSQGLYTFPVVMPTDSMWANVALVGGHYFQGVMSIQAQPMWHAVPGPGEARSGVEGFMEIAPYTWRMGYGRQNGKFACVDVADGTVKWELPLDGAASDTITCDVDGDGQPEFVFATTHGTLYAVGDGGDTPRLVWKKAIGAAGGPPIAADITGDGKSEIVLQTADGTLTVLGVH